MLIPPAPSSEYLTLFSDLLDSLGLGFCAFDDQDRTLVWNRTFLVFFPEHAGHVHAGEPYRSNLERFYAFRLSEDERPLIERYIADGIARHRSQIRPFVFFHRDRWLRVASQRLPEGGGRVRIWAQIPKPQERAAIYQMPQLADGDATGPDTSLEHVAEGMAVCDLQGHIQHVNSHFLRLYRIDNASEVLGLRFREVLARMWAREAAPPETASAPSHWEAALLDNERFTSEPYTVPLPGEHWVRVVNHIADDGRLYSIHVDITSLQRQMRAHEQQVLDLDFRARHDGLTQLPNRSSLEAHLQEALLESPTGGRCHVLCFLDLDGFKPVNDTAGHAAGDEVLQSIARLFSDQVRPLDVVARLGGDEFCILLRDTTASIAEMVAQRIIDRLRDMPQRWQDHAFAVGVSIGLTLIRPGTDSIATVLARADQACYQAKDAGRNQLAWA